MPEAREKLEQIKSLLEEARNEAISLDELEGSDYRIDLGEDLAGDILQILNRYF